jgi:general secretion pathway protein J
MRCNQSIDGIAHASRQDARSVSMCRGFTLVELLVAISILAIVAVLGWRGLDSIVRSRTALTETLEQTRGLQLAFAQLQNDCINITPAATLMNRLPLQTAGKTLLMVRNVMADNQPIRLQAVTYRIRDGVLTRWESPAVRDLGELDKWLQFAQSNAPSSQEVMLQSGVDAINLRVWNNGWLDGDNTISPEAVASTIGLEVTLQLHGQSVAMQKIFLLGAA